MSVPVSVWQGTFTVFGAEVRCHVLSDGQRVIEAESVEALLEAMGSEDARDYLDGLGELARWMGGADAVEAQIESDISG